MARLKGLRDRRGRIFSGITVAESYVPTGDIALTAMAMAVTSIEDPDADSIDSIDVQPARGRAIVQTGTNRISLDLRDEPSTSDLIVVYTRTISAVQSQVTAVVSVSAPIHKDAWAGCQFYRPEVDGATDDLVIEPHSSTRVILYKENGLTEADIAAMEVGYSNVTEENVTQAWLGNNKAQSGTLNDAYYGETDALALAWSTADKLARNLDNTEFNSWWFRLKRGETFSNSLSSINLVFGYSGLHPIRFDTYGSGARPIVNGRGIDANHSWNVVAGGWESKDKNDVTTSMQNWCLDDTVVDTRGYGAQAGPAGGDADGNGWVSRHWSVRRQKGVGLHKPPTGVEGTWTGVQNSGWHPGESAWVLFEKVYGDEAGAGWNYRADGSTLEVPCATNFNHGIYQPNLTYGHYWKDIVMLRSAHNAAQHRAGGIIHNFVAMGHGPGINPGWGARDVNGFFGVQDLWAGNYTMYDRVWFGKGGFKGLIDETGYATGPQIGGPDISLINSGSINSGDPIYFDGEIAASLQFGPGTQPGVVPGGNFWIGIKINESPGANPTVPGTTASGSNFVVSNYNRSIQADGTYADGKTQSALPAGAASEATRDAATIEAYTDTLLATSGSTFEDFCDHLNDNVDDPWVHADLLADYWANVCGFPLKPTPSADATITYRPNPDFFTPKYWACIDLDWDAQHLPGEATGQSVDLDGHRVDWNFTPTNSLDEFTFGAGGKVDHYGGKVAIDTAINVDTGGNSWIIHRGGAKLDLPAYTSSNLLTLETTDGRVRFLGNTTGAIDLTAHWRSEIVVDEGVSVTIPSGRTWDLFGHTDVGFDGDSAGTATITQNGTVSFSPSIILEVDTATKFKVILNNANEGITDFYTPKIGTIVRGVTSGATGIVRDRKDRTTTRFLLVVDTLTGVFIDNEELTADEAVWYTFDAGEQSIGLVRGAPEYVMPTIKEVFTGLNGFTNPDGSTSTPMRPIGPSVVSTYVLGSGSTVEVSTVGLASGTYDLIDVDSLTDNGATLPSGVSVVGNKLQLVVS